MARRSAVGAVGVNVEGLEELSKALKQMDNGLDKELRKAGREVAKFVTADAKGAAAGLGSTAAKSAPSLRASAGAAYAGVSLGGGGYPFALGAEFGGRGRPTTQQFQPWRGSGEGAGYFLYPTILRDQQRIEDEYGQALDDVIRKAGLK